MDNLHIIVVQLTFGLSQVWDLLRVLSGEDSKDLAVIRKVVQNPSVFRSNLLKVDYPRDQFKFRLNGLRILAVFVSGSEPQLKEDLLGELLALQPQSTEEAKAVMALAAEITAI